MTDTQIWAQRTVAGYEVYLRRPSSEARWEISLCEKVINPETAVAERMLLSQRLSNHPILKQTFATPDEAAEQLRPILSQRPATHS
jgi:hypothetical protein